MEQKPVSTIAVDAIINNVKAKDLKYVMIPIGEDYEYTILDLTAKDDLLVFIEYLK